MNDELELSTGSGRYRPLEAEDYDIRESKVTGHNALPSFMWSMELNAAIILAVFLFGGACVYRLAWHWTYFNALYFCVVSMTTVGYGHFVPTTTGMKIFTVVYVYIGFAFVAGCLGYLVGRTVSESVNRVKLTSVSGNGKIAKCKIQFTSNQGDLLRSFIIILSLGTVGTIFFSYNEGMSTLNAFYFSMITMSSVGYGDIVVEKTSSKVFNLFFIIISVPLIGMVLFKFVEVWVRIEEQKWISNFGKRGVTKEVLRAMDKDSTGTVERHEFLSYMLVHLGKVQASDIDYINNLFNRLDRDGSGCLDIDDIESAIEIALPTDVP